jgi:single-strand DNA-binding protein
MNKVILIGNVGKDPEVRYLQDGTPVANFSIATTEQWKDKQTGEKRKSTEWHNVVAWRRLAEIIGEWVTKGQKLMIEGKLQTRSWDKDDGSKGYKTEIVANNMEMLGGGRGTGSSGDQGYSSGPPQGQPPSGGAPMGGGAPGGRSYPGQDDDIPF